MAYREENGRFTERKQLLKVAKLGPKAYEQCAGFMRIQGGGNPLDATSVHPEKTTARQCCCWKNWTADRGSYRRETCGISKKVKDYKNGGDAGDW